MSKKEEKKKVRAFPIMLILTTILLVASTYAWFVANSTVRVKSLKLGVDEVAGLQISADADIWRAELDSTILSEATAVDAAYETGINQIPAENADLSVGADPTIKPVSSPLTVANGKLNIYEGETSIDNDGNFTLTTTKATDTKGETGNYFAFDIFLKADKDMEIDLDTTSNVKTTGRYADGISKNPQLESAARVAFVTLGHATLDTSADEIRALTSDAGPVYVWEPNADMHKEYIGVTGAVKTDAVSAAFSDMLLTERGSEANKVNFKSVGNTTLNYAKGTPNYLTTGKDAGSIGTSETNGQKLIRLTSGITKLRCYVWIEGQDVDCNNDITGAEIAADISFTVNGQIPREVVP